jgi:hypothetical protein
MMGAWLAVVLVSELVAAPALAITLGQVDTFQGGLLAGWGGGSSPTNVPGGGPGGAGDRYLEVSASNFHLGARNQAQWTGDYLAAGVDEIAFDLNNFGPDPLALRVNIFGPGGTFTSTNETVLAAGSGWVTASFSLTEAELTRTQGTGTLDQTLVAVSILLLRHDPDPASPPAEENLVTATLGIDNVTALPEPGMPLLLAAALPTLAALARVRSRRGAARDVGARHARAPRPG